MDILGPRGSLPAGNLEFFSCCVLLISNDDLFVDVVDKGLTLLSPLGGLEMDVLRPLVATGCLVAFPGPCTLLGFLGLPLDLVWEIKKLKRKLAKERVKRDIHRVHLLVLIGFTFP
jgi:hypothetical protein